jgi:hypothetical protein
MSKVMECPRCGENAVWTEGLQLVRQGALALATSPVPYYVTRRHHEYL